MSTGIPTLPGITSKVIATQRLHVHALFSGADSAEPVVFIHGNASSATFFEQTMLALPATYRGIALDLRGYGATEDALVDATSGVGDWVEDFAAFAAALRLERFHLVGHSLGGLVVYGIAASALGAQVKTVTVVAPASPFGFGGTKGLHGTPCHADFAGSGAGLVNADFARLMAEQYRGADNPQASPRLVMNSFYWKPPFTPAREEDLLSSLLSQKVGPQKYPGDSVPSPNWPMLAPGVFGPINACAPKYLGSLADDFVRAAVERALRPPVLWVRGADDQIVSDTSLFDVGFLGKLGAIPGWPGDQVYPPQPMVGQTRAFFEKYHRARGSFREVVFSGCGHSPFIEKPREFDQTLAAQLARG